MDHRLPGPVRAWRRTGSWAAGALASVAVFAGLWSARSHGTDFLDMLLGGQRLLAGTNLYEGSGPAYGMVGPPFQAVVLAPFAWLASLDVGAARIAWALTNLVAGVAGLIAWRRALDVPWAAMALGAGTVAFPLYRELQLQNITLLLFAATGAAALALTRGRDVEAGAWIGLATAVKLFPGLVAVYLAARGRWRAAIAAGVAALAFSLTPVVRFGPAGFMAQWERWLESRLLPGFPVWMQNQSLSIALGRVVSPAVATAAVVALALALAWIGYRLLRRGAAFAAAEAALAGTMAVVLSPIAWIPYWVLLLPAVASLAASGRPVLDAVVFAFGLLVTGMAVFQREAPGLETLIAALLLSATLATHLLARRRV
jgi:alpha-1,2-mannosyltransferase